MSVVLARLDSRRDHVRKPQGKRVGPAKQRGTWRKFIYKLKNKDKATFYSPVKLKAPILISKFPEEREFMVDSGASMHMLSKGIQAQMKWVLCEDPGPLHNGGNSQWRSANKRGSTSIRSRSRLFRDGAITRGHACSSIAWFALRRTQTLL